MEFSGSGAVLWKNCMQTRRMRRGMEEKMLVIGGACSEVFSGPQLAKVLHPAIEQQQKALITLALGEGCSPLSIHTSVGVPSAVGDFTEAFKDHLPWAQSGDDWILNLQIEGATAVLAGIEALFQVIDAEKALGHRKDHPSLLATAEKCYHGPSVGGLTQPAKPRWPGAPLLQEGQVKYPVPAVGEEHSKFMKRFQEFLDNHGKDIGVIVFEPQWGSTWCARPWPKATLQEAVRMCHSRGILVMCDEIMCGLGRHGQGTLFLSKAWSLEPDAVTFGKSISAGPYPMSGCLIKKGAKALAQRGAGVLAQSHTYAGSSTMALLTGTEVLKLVPEYFDHAAKMGHIFKEILGPLNDDVFCHIHGQGLMWGGQFCDQDPAKRQKALGIFKAQCEKERVAPYYVPVGGWMMTPPMDTKEEDLREALTRIHRAATHTRTEMAKAA